MATIDSRIAMGVQPLDIGASIGRGYQLRDLAAQSDARALDAQLKQQAVQKQRTLGDLYRTATTDGKLDRSAFSQGVADAGYGADLPAIQKGWTDQDKAHAEYLSKNSDRIIKQMDYIGRTAASLLANPNTTTDDAIRAVSGLTQFGLLSPEDGAQIARTVPGDPDQLRQWLQQQAITAQSNKDALEVILPKVQAQNLGGRTVMVDTNPLTNPAVVGQTFQRTATPGEVESARHNRVQEGQAAANADRTANAANWTFNKDLGVLVNSKTGETRKAEGGDTERVRDAKDAIELITQAQDLLKKGPTGSYGGAAIDAGLRTLGMSTKGADIAAQLKALEGALVSKMPKMSGPQSDKDVAMYKQMAATIGDSTIPVRQRLAALDQVLEIQQRYAGIKPQGEAALNINGGVLTPPQTPKNQRDQQVQAKMLQQAKDAIASGAPKEAVIQRLQTMGIDPKGL